MSAHTYIGYPTRSAYENARADALRTQLYALLGGRCAECDAATNLEIDHPWGRDWKPRRLSRYRRHLRYWQEAQVGKVRLLCKECNCRLLPKRVEAPPATVCPF